MCNACIAHYINLSLKVLVIATCQNGFLYKRKPLSLCLIMCGWKRACQLRLIMQEIKIEWP